MAGSNMEPDIVLSSGKTAVNETDMALPLLEKVKARHIFFITKLWSVRGTICLSASLPFNHLTVELSYKPDFL